MAVFYKERVAHCQRDTHRPFIFLLTARRMLPMCIPSGHSKVLSRSGRRGRSALRCVFLVFSPAARILPPRTLLAAARLRFSFGSQTCSSTNHLPATTSFRWVFISSTTFSFRFSILLVSFSQLFLLPGTHSYFVDRKLGIFLPHWKKIQRDWRY